MERTVQSSCKKEKKKKKSKDEIDRLKQAEKKKRRLKKALAASAAIRVELEKKKQMKKEEQERLDEEGAAIAEAVALHCLIGEEEAIDSSNGVDLFMGYKNYDVYERRDDGWNMGWNPWFQTAEALSSLHISDESRREVVMPRIRNSTMDAVSGRLRGSCVDREVDFYGGF